MRRLSLGVMAFTVITFVLSCDVKAQQCWDIEQVGCAALYEDHYCSEQNCLNDVCPQETIEQEATPYSVNLGDSNGGPYEGTTRATPESSVYCLIQRDCDSGCAVYSGVNRCQNGASDIFLDPDSRDAAKRYDEVGTGVCYYSF